MLRKKIFGSSLFLLQTLILVFVSANSERILQAPSNQTNLYPPGSDICFAKGQLSAELLRVNLDSPLQVVQVIIINY